MLDELLHCLAEMFDGIPINIEPSDAVNFGSIEIMPATNYGYAAIVILKDNHIAIHNLGKHLIDLPWGDFADPSHNPEETLQAIAAKARELYAH